MAPADIGDERAEILLRRHECELIRSLVLNQAIARCYLLRAKAEEVGIARRKHAKQKTERSESHERLPAFNETKLSSYERERAGQEVREGSPASLR